MITETDALNSVEFEKYFVILPSSAKLGWTKDEFIKDYDSGTGKMCKFGFSYNSGTNKDSLNVKELQELIQNYI